MKWNKEHTPIPFFFYKALRFVLIFALLDITGGFILRKMYFSQKTGKFARMTHSLNKTNADILLVGTSHTVRHFVPEVFSDSLQAATYNIGARGQDLYYCAAITDEILDRYQPKELIWNIDPDMFLGAEKYDKLSALKPYYWQNEALRPYVNLQGPTEKYKLLSSFYTYNSTLIHIIKYLMIPQKDFDGYLPMEGICDKEVSPESQKLDAPEIEITDAQLELMDRIMAKAKDKGVGVHFVISPILAGDKIHSSRIDQLALRYDIPVWNYSLDERFVLKNELFGDQSHLNHTGALLFSAVIASQIKHYSDNKENG